MDFSKIKSLLGRSGKSPEPDSAGLWTCAHCGKKGTRIGDGYRVTLFKPEAHELPKLVMGLVRRCEACAEMLCKECVAKTRRLACPQCGAPWSITADDVDEWCQKLTSEPMQADILVHVSLSAAAGKDKDILLNEIRDILKAAGCDHVEDYYAQIFALRLHLGLERSVWTVKDLLIAAAAMKAKVTGTNDLFAAAMKDSGPKPTK